MKFGKDETKKLIAMKTYITLFLCILMTNPVKAELKGKGRDDFVQNFKESCIDEAKKEPSNKGLDIKIIKKLCGCIATYYADNSDINKIFAETSNKLDGKYSEWWEMMKNNSGSYCIKNFGKY